MPRKLTKRAARALSALRTIHAGGRPPKPTRCRVCQAVCPSASLARVHCSKAGFLAAVAEGARQRAIEGSKGFIKVLEDASADLKKKAGKP